MRNEVRRPLPPGAPVVYWRISGVRENRYDTPDVPMAGEMDPFFFLSKEKNFIPHEYPCRTQFAAERRGCRPQVATDLAIDRWWFPFGSPRVDLSGFWFRPTVIAASAKTSIHAESAGRTRLRLSTCGGAVLWVNEMEAGWIAPYARNREDSAEFEVEFDAGPNAIEVHFDDLAERDARFYFQLDYLDGPAVSVALQTPVSEDAALGVEALLEGLRFDRPSYVGGDVRLLFPAPLPIAATAKVVVEGDVVGAESLELEFDVPAGATSISLGPADGLPADFRHYTLGLDAAGLVVSRTLGVEVCHVARQGQPAVNLENRVAESLAYVADNGEPEALRALASLALGRSGAESNSWIANVLPAIEDCHDCADFALVPLLWIRKVFPGALDPALRARTDRAILGYRYWMDEPGNDVQWYFSENHALLFHTAAYLAGDILPDALFHRSGRTGRDHSAIGARRVRAWLNHFGRWEMAEFNSAPYFPIDLKGLCALAALAPHADVRARAASGIGRLLEIVARSAHHGVLTAAQGRSYEHSLRPARTLELSAISRLLWGRGWFGRRVHCLPMLALLIRDHGFVPPPQLASQADLSGDEHVEWCFAQGPEGIAKLYHYKSRVVAMGSVARYRWGEWGYQETPLHLRLGEVPEAQVWINHPGETIQFGGGRPSFWGGNGTLPRVHQYRGLAVLLFDIHEGQPDFTHAWFPAGAFDASEVDGTIAVARSGDGLVLLKGGAPFERIDAGPSAGVELRQSGRRSLWIVRVADAGTASDLQTMRARFGGLELTVPAGEMLELSDPEYGMVRFHADGVIEAEGRRIDPSTWTIAGESTILAQTIWPE